MKKNASKPSLNGYNQKPQRCPKTGLIKPIIVKEYPKEFALVKKFRQKWHPKAVQRKKGKKKSFKKSFGEKSQENSRRRQSIMNMNNCYGNEETNNEISGRYNR